jgi:predicted anti-sigma-YlaC factor YlaD
MTLFGVHELQCLNVGTTKAVIKILTARAWLLVSLDPLNAGLAVAIATAGDLVGLTENQQTHRALTLNLLGRALNKLEIKTSCIILGNGPLFPSGCRDSQSCL